MSTTENPTQLLDVIIVGGGLSGMVVARELYQWGNGIVNWRLLEARPRLGGRLKNDEDGCNIDLGGAWIWPHVQPRIKKLVKDLSISTFPQPDDISDGSMRMVGGAVQMIHKIAETLPSENILLNSPVVSCSLRSPTTTNCDATVEVQTLRGEVYLARKLVLAAPPLVILKHIRFVPPLSPSKQIAMESCPTWMAAVTKVSLVYPTRFWDKTHSNCGLRGTPAFQMYDASTPDGKVFALTFFTLVPSNTTYKTDDRLLACKVAEQIGSVWKRSGQDELAECVKGYSSYHVQRWPEEPYISHDPNPPKAILHPTPNPILSQPEWNGSLLFSGSETDQDSPGMMVGAVGAALRVAEKLEQWWRIQTTSRENHAN